MPRMDRTWALTREDGRLSSFDLFPSTLPPHIDVVHYDCDAGSKVCI